ncbi:MAG: ABC transporter substrate-binding protein [Deltaproteobacteria bacterium]|nr:ABC transporter substrate-binding protein [Deltaproteobacteria bacterium]
MKLKNAKRLLWLALVLVLGLTMASCTKKASRTEQYFPTLTYRTGPFAPSGIPIANGFRDYYTLINSKGGMNGVKLEFEECETEYNTKLGVECYEKLKGKGASYFNPFSTGITYQLIPKAAVDKIPLLSSGYGRTSAGDGRVFEWVFNFPTTYWSQASVFIKYIGSQLGGMDKLKGKKIALVYHNSAYGKEPIPTLEALAKQLGYELQLLAVESPGQEQKATWLQIRQNKPDWVLMWGWGVMNSVAVKEAASIGYPMDHFIGVWWSGSEADVIPAGDGAKGYKAGNFHGVGTNYPVLQEILKTVYGGDEKKARENNWGEVLYDRAVVNAMYGLEAMRTAQAKYGNRVVTGEEMRWGFENLDLTAARLKELGMEGFAQPIKITCEDHESNGPVYIQQWDGKEWKMISDWITPMREVVRPMIEADAAAYAKENNITPRSCK